VVYESAAEAARQLDKSASFISKQVRKKAPGYRLLNIINQIFISTIVF
jgi:hypothetical protein